MEDLGLEISHKKLVPPDIVVICLGIQIDMVTGALSILDQKITEIIALCKSWTCETYCSNTVLHSLLGILLYISTCVKPARFFGGQGGPQWQSGNTLASHL